MTKRSIWNYDGNQWVQIAPPSTDQERAAILQELGWGEEAGIPHGRGVRTCTDGGEATESVMIIPEDKHPEDYAE